jgi:hypothetical protein
MNNDAVLVKPLDNYRLYVELKNGKKGIFDVSPYLDKGALKMLRDESYFQRVEISLGVVTWPHEQDIAPLTLENGLTPAASVTTQNV